MNIIIILLVILIIIETIRLSVLGYRSKLLAKRAVRFSRTSNPKAPSILIAGDSLAYGTGASSATFSLAGRLAQDYQNYTIVNIAENGANFNQVTQQLVGVRKQKFDIIIIFVGGIDTICLLRLTKAKQQLSKLYREAKKLGSRHVIHVSVNNTGSTPMFRFPLNYLFSYRSLKMSELVNSLTVKHNIIHHPLYILKKYEPLLKQANCFSGDKIHPNDQGYEIWYKEIKQTISRYLKDI